jgi:hypothetical protein
MHAVILPPNINYGRLRGGDVAELDEHTITALEKQFGVRFHRVGEVPGEGETAVEIPPEPKPDPQTVVRIKLPPNVKWRDKRGGDIATMQYAEVAALEAATKLSIPLLTEAEEVVPEPERSSFENPETVTGDSASEGKAKPPVNRNKVGKEASDPRTA